MKSSNNGNDQKQKRIAIVSVPFLGHLNVLLSLRKHLLKQENVDVHLYILSFDEFNLQNVEKEVGQLLKEENVTELVANVKMGEHAATFNDCLASKLTNILHCVLYDWRPTLIVYDFFCFSARNVARLLGVPAICSIPAVLKEHEISTCSDALLFPEHLYWIWQSPYQVDLSRESAVQFLGSRSNIDDSLQMVLQRDVSFEQKKSLFDRWIFISFGTVVPRYEGHLKKLEEVMMSIQKMTLLTENQNTLFVFANLNNFENMFQGSNCLFLPYCDQVTMLNHYRPECFIFHGGGNSFSEATFAQIPCVVCPFFGDQEETARIVGCRYEKGKDMNELIKKAKIPGLNQGPHHLVKPFTDDFSTFFRNGDLVYGHRKHRNNLQKMFPNIDLHLDHYCSFFQFADTKSGVLPAIADVFNDEGLSPLLSDEQKQTIYGQRLQDVLEIKRLMNLDHIKEYDHKLVHWCVGILILAMQKWNIKVHFLLDDETEMGYATREELEFVTDEQFWQKLRFCDNVIFYRYGKRCCAPIRNPPKVRVANDKCNEIRIDHFECVKHFLDRPNTPPFYSGRKKSVESQREKQDVRRLPLIDIHAFRIPYLHSEQLKDITIMQDNVKKNHSSKLVTMKGRIVYYYFDEERVELQIWPYTYLSFFYKDMFENGVNLDKHKEMQEKIQDKIEEMIQ